MRRAMGWIGGIGLLASALIAGYLMVGRRWHLRWGATESERRSVMPGDELVARPSLVATRAVTIEAPPAAVWPWLVQMGYRRAGWYSYDRFDNDGRVVRRIIPELQNLEVGDLMLTDAKGGFRVEVLEPERVLVLMIHGGPGRGDLDISAALVLVPLPSQRTRLLLRLRAEFRGRLERVWGALLFDVGDFVMMRRMLIGIRERAESAWLAGPAQRSTPGAPRLPPRWFIRAAWMAHRALFAASGGRLGLQAATADRWGTMRLRSVGRRTGAERTAILGYFEDGPNLVTMAMNGWADPEPAWWLNLQAHPDTTVDLADGSRAVHARAADPEERPRLWARWAVYDKGLDGYAALRSRETAVVILEPRPA